MRLFFNLCNVVILIIKTKMVASESKQIRKYFRFHCGAQINMNRLQDYCTLTTINEDGIRPNKIKLKISTGAVEAYEKKNKRKRHKKRSKNRM